MAHYYIHKDIHVIFLFLKQHYKFVAKNHSFTNREFCFQNISKNTDYMNDIMPPFYSLQILHSVNSPHACLETKSCYSLFTSFCTMSVRRKTVLVGVVLIIHPSRPVVRYNLFKSAFGNISKHLKYSDKLNVF